MRRADQIRSAVALGLLGATLALGQAARGSDLIVEQAVVDAAEQAAEQAEDAKLQFCLDQAEVGDREYDQRVLDDCMNDHHPQMWDARE